MYFADSFIAQALKEFFNLQKITLEDYELVYVKDVTKEQTLPVQLELQKKEK